MSRAACPPYSASLVHFGRLGSKVELSSSNCVPRLGFGVPAGLGKGACLKGEREFGDLGQKGEVSSGSQTSDSVSQVVL